MCSMTCNKFSGDQRQKYNIIVYIVRKDIVRKNGYLYNAFFNPVSELFSEKIMGKFTITFL